MRKYEEIITAEDNEQSNPEWNYERNREHRQEQNQGTKSRTQSGIKSGTKSKWNQELNRNEIRNKINQIMEQKMSQHDKIKIERIKDQHNELKNRNRKQSWLPNGTNYWAILSDQNTSCDHNDYA